jgi:hypothetical protein
VVSAFLAKEDGADRVPYTNILRGLLAAPGRPMSKKMSRFVPPKVSVPYLLIK